VGRRLNPDVAITNGYSFDNMEPVSATTYPVGAAWYDAVKWCNARSQMEGLRPVYYLEEAFTNLYVADRNDLQNSFVDWSANGYRLPTEAEWEKGARGGASGMRFPWTDWTNCISFAKANYYAMSMYSYDLSNGTHPTYGGMPAPVGSFEPTGYGLHDMAGNAPEWCWDSYDSEYYHSSPSDNPHGPTNTTPAVVVRGGGFNDGGVSARCCARWQSSREGYSGFRCVRRQ
jgi:formylglycine-generating enzyme required for sulfatase activity